MIKILSATQIRKADQYTIKHEPVASIDLMERAAKAFCKQFTSDFPNPKESILIFCGPGNNGGDGLAIARILSSKKYRVTIFYLDSKNYSTDFTKNFNRLKKAYKISVKKDIPLIQKKSIIIDALFGSGLNQPLNGIAKELVSQINSSRATVVSVDIPSGLFADIPSRGTMIRANKVYTFQFPKLSFFFPSNGTCIPDFNVMEIGLSPDIIEKEKTNFYLTEKKDIALKIKPRPKFSHKGMYGHALIIAGSEGKIGAAVLSAKAALRAGCGLLTVHVPKCGVKILQTAFPEAMCSIDLHTTHLTKFPSTNNSDAIAIGPGIGTHKETVQAFRSFLKEKQKPIIVDADGLNILATNKDLLPLLPNGSILTPHPKEFERLAGKWKNDPEKLELLKQFSKKYKVITVLKGANTAVCNINGEIFFNPTGNPGMATAGSGDTLTGILCGLLAQDFSPFDTALIGVFLHGLAGDIALGEQSEESLIASDITNNLGKAFKELKV